VGEFSPFAAFCGWQHSPLYAANLLILKDLLQDGETGVTLAALAFGNWECS
jgi:hypothetical protein